MSSTSLVYIALFVVVVIGAILVGAEGRNFFSTGNLRDVFTGMSVLGLVGIGQTLVILSRSLDLSVPYVMSLSSLIAAQTMSSGGASIAVGVVLALLFSAAVGLVNGLVVTKLRVHGFIATLGVGLIIKGYLDTTYKGSAGSVPKEFQFIGSAAIGAVPVSTIGMLALAAAVYFLLTKTRTGHHIYAVGGSAEVSRLSGLRTSSPVIISHVLCSLSAGLAGILLASRLGVGSPTVGTQGGYDLLSIAAVVVGGTLLSGGHGSIWGTIGGVAIFAVLDSVMSAIQFNPFLKDVVRGLVIVVAVAIYSRRSSETKRVRFPEKGK
jgi:ribose transport system permease protein